MKDQVFIDCLDCRNEVEAGTRKRVNHARFGCGCPSNGDVANEDHFICGQHQQGHPESYPLRDGGDLMKWPPEPGGLAEDSDEEPAGESLYGFDEPKADPRHKMKCCGAAFLLAPEEDAPCPNCGAI